MDIIEEQKDKKVIIQFFDNGRRVRIVFQDLKDSGKYIVAELSRDTTQQLATGLHCKELERLLEKKSKKEM